MRSETWRAKGEIAEGLEDINHIQQEIEIPDLTDITSDEEQFDRQFFYDIWERDRISYPYSKYRDG
mgnify:FL=1